jgi:hypothetical protein
MPQLRVLYLENIFDDSFMENLSLIVESMNQRPKGSESVFWGKEHSQDVGSDTPQSLKEVLLQYNRDCPGESEAQTGNESITCAPCGNCREWAACGRREAARQQEIRLREAFQMDHEGALIAAWQKDLVEVKRHDLIFRWGVVLVVFMSPALIWVLVRGFSSEWK